MLDRGLQLRFFLEPLTPPQSTFKSFNEVEEMSSIRDIVEHLQQDVLAGNGVFLIFDRCSRGWSYVKRGFTLSEFRHQLRQRDVVVPEVYWLYAPEGRLTWVAPMGAPAFTENCIRKLLGPSKALSRHLRRAFLTVLLRKGLLPWIGESVGLVLASRDDCASYAEEVLNSACRSSGLMDVVPGRWHLFVIPSGLGMPNKKVVMVSAPCGQDEPLMVLKVAEGEAGRLLLRQSSATLKAVHSNINDSPVLASIPRPLHSDTVLGSPAVVESFVSGVPLQHFVKDPGGERCAELALDWLIKFHRLTAETTIISEELLETHFLHPLVSAHQLFNGEMPFLGSISQWKDRMRKLMGLPIPLVCQHSDYVPRNVHVEFNEVTGVVDWESAKWRGLPLLDVLSFGVWWIALAASRSFKWGFDVLLSEGDYSRNPFHRFMSRYLAEMNIEPSLVPSLVLVFLLNRLQLQYRYRHEVAECLREWLGGQYALAKC